MNGTRARVNRLIGKTKMRVLIDADVLLGYVMNRGAHIAAFETVLDLAIKKQIDLYITSYAIHKLWFFLDHHTDHGTSIFGEFMGSNVIEINSSMIAKACESPVENIDAALTIEAAKKADVDAVVTLDALAFSKSKFPVWLINELIIRLELEETVSWPDGKAYAGVPKIRTIPRDLFEDLSAYVDNELSIERRLYIERLIQQEPLINYHILRLQKMRSIFQEPEVFGESSDIDVDDVVNNVIKDSQRSRIRFNILVAGGVILLFVLTAIVQATKGSYWPQMPLRIAQDPEDVIKAKRRQITPTDILPDKSSVGAVERPSPELLEDSEPPATESELLTPEELSEDGEIKNIASDLLPQSELLDDDGEPKDIESNIRPSSEPLEDDELEDNASEDDEIKDIEVDVSPSTNLSEEGEVMDIESDQILPQELTDTSELAEENL